MAWDQVCRLKDVGGLGLRRTAAVNTAFQCKLTWKVLTNNGSMWVRFMHTKYLWNQEFFCLKAKQGDSIEWRNILKCKKLIHKGMVWNVGMETTSPSTMITG